VRENPRYVRKTFRLGLVSRLRYPVPNVRDSEFTIPLYVSGAYVRETSPVEDLRYGRITQRSRMGRRHVKRPKVELTGPSSDPQSSANRML
jgi:hypothetical protein